MAKNTKKDIIRAFERLLAKREFEKITVKDITENAGINRKTFYYYFADIDDLMTKAFDWEIQNFLDNIPSGATAHEAIMNFFTLVSESKDVVYHIYNSSRSEHLTEYIRTAALSMVKSTFVGELKDHNITEEQKDVVYHIYSFAISGFIIMWIDSGMQTDIVEHIKQIGTMLDGGIEFLLKNAEKINSVNKS